MDEHELMGKMKISKAVAKMAIPSVISSLVTVVYNMADTFFVGQTGDSLQVAAVSLTNPIFILMMAFANMLGMGGSAVVALGEKNELRAKKTSSFVTYASLIIGIVFAAVLYFVLREPIIRLFISDEVVVSYGVEMLVAYMLSGPVIGILFVNMNCMQSVGHAFPATVLSVLRQGILLIPLLYLLRALFGLNGVILGQSVTDYIAVVLSIFLWRKIRRSLPSGAIEY